MTTAITPGEVTPETKPSVSTGDVLALVETVFDRYIRFPSPPARDAVVLWVAHTHLIGDNKNPGAWVFTPRLTINSAEPGCGKTRVLKLIAELVPKALFSVNTTPSVIWRRLAQGGYTILIDESDSIFGTLGGSGNGHLRAIINAGDEQGAVVSRAHGSADVIDFPVYGAVALAGLGVLHKTIESRSIHVEMRRPTENEHVTPYRPSDAAPHLAAVRGTLAIWGLWALADLALARPAMPVRGRDADVWEPLTAIADHAGGDWPDRVRDACIQLTAKTEHQSIGTMLLADIREVWPVDKRGQPQRKVFTATLLGSLHGYHDWTARNLDAGTLARHLAPYGIKPGTVRSGDKTAKGYQLDQLTAAWAEYLPSHVTRQAA